MNDTERCIDRATKILAAYIHLLQQRQMRFEGLGGQADNWGTSLHAMTVASGLVKDLDPELFVATDPTDEFDQIFDEVWNQ